MNTCALYAISFATAKGAYDMSLKTFFLGLLLCTSAFC